MVYAEWLSGAEATRRVEKLIDARERDKPMLTMITSPRAMGQRLREGRS